jgi:molybdopterin-containing oxidoreductase family membrane subunit
MAVTRTWRIGWMVLFGLMVNLGAIGKRYLIVVPSETHGQLLPYPVGEYAPSLVEYAVVIGLFSLGALLIGGFMKLFPIVEMEETP